MGAVVGIDLGTTYSVVAHIGPDGKPVVIPNSNGQRTTPSIVAFGDGTPHVGFDAKVEQANGNQEVASFFKRNMGNSAFTLVFDGREYTPTDLSALVLGYLKAQAEAYLHESVSDVVITVPAYFKDEQRQETIRAGRMAGLNVLAIISEPTAAALAYGIRPGPSEQNLLVYDLGGGTFDVSIVRVTPTELTVVSTDGDHNLGGKDWDDRLLGYLQERFQQDFGVDLLANDFNQTLVEAENLKRRLSATERATIRLTAGGHTATFTISREQFADLSSDLMERTGQLTEQALREAKLGWPQISSVLPVGGSTRMPMVIEWITRTSGGPPMIGVNPDEAVALGAAIWADVKLEEQNPRLLLSFNRPSAKLLLGGRKPQDVIAHTMGMIAVSEDRERYVNSHIIPKNSHIPSSQTRPYTIGIRRDGQTKQEIFVTQGENDSPFDCSYTGLYAFTGFPSLSIAETQVDVTYSYTENGTVEVSACEHSTGAPLRGEKLPVPDDVPGRFAGKPSSQQSVGGAMVVYLAFDLSGSMCGKPLADAQRAAHAFVSQCDLRTTAIGMIGFSDDVRIYQQATQEKGKISHAIDTVGCCDTGGGNSGHPFDTFYELLQNQAGRRFGIVLADGMWSNQEYDVTRAQQCHQTGIEIIAIGFGSADQSFLRRIASSDQQSFFTSQGQLSETFSTIARELSNR